MVRRADDPDYIFYHCEVGDYYLGPAHRCMFCGSTRIYVNDGDAWKLNNQHSYDDNIRANTGKTRRL